MGRRHIPALRSSARAARSAEVTRRGAPDDYAASDVSLPEMAEQALSPASRAQPAELKPAPLLPLLPPELPWLYVVIPLPAAALVGHDPLGRPGPGLLLSLARMYLPFAGYGLAFHLLYRFVMPRLLWRVTAPWARW